MSSYTTPTFPSMENPQMTPTSSFGYPQQGYQVPAYPQQGYQTPAFPQTPTIPTGFPGVQPGLVRFEESYIENILRLNKGKMATVYMNFENSQWGSKVFKGIIEAAGKDHIILRDPATDMRYLLLSIYLNYITFDEEISYEYPFNNSSLTGIVPPITPNTQLRKKENKPEQNK